ncbi:phosphoglycolate phosphatase [Candidatus Geothermarchaeota archaeon]|nr:MAG: phosphoglycolate phosphatase [Candidatus Geothermarchaeota archaeon]HEW93267.1 phosphoglycolate phosphatase [Thermoprotei archaeon]
MSRIDLSDIRVVVIDVDGTITDETDLLSIEAIERIRLLERSGFMTILASGNALPVTKALAHYIGSSGPVIAESGCVVDILDDIITFGNPDSVLDALNEIKRLFGNRVRESWSNRYRHVDKVISPTIPKDKLIEIVSKYPDISILDSKFAFHIHPKDVDKFLGVKAISETLNISLDEIAAVGDSELEIRLLKNVGFGAALDNSPDKLKEVADYVTKEKYWRGFIEFTDLLLESRRV